MKITLKYLKKAWNEERLKKIREEAFVIGSDKLFGLKDRMIINSLIDAVWSNDHDGSVAKRNECREKYGLFKHVFISRICDIAVEEYQTVCRLLKVKRILLVSSKTDNAFFIKSKKMLKKIPGIKIISLRIEA